MKYVLPKRFIRVHRRDAGTKAIQDTQTGRFQGRVRVTGKGDTTSLRQVTKDVDVNHDGKIDFYGGTTAGRSKRLVRGSGGKRAFERSI